MYDTAPTKASAATMMTEARINFRPIDMGSYALVFGDGTRRFEGLSRFVALVDDQPFLRQERGAVEDDQGLFGDAQEQSSPRPFEGRRGVQHLAGPQGLHLVVRVGQDAELLPLPAEDDHVGLPGRPPARLAEEDPQVEDGEDLAARVDHAEQDLRGAGDRDVVAE